MTIREVIEMLTYIFNLIAEYLGPVFEGMFGGADEEGEEATEPEA